MNAFDRKLLKEALCKVLANTFVLALKTQNFHWNVTGCEFVSLHSFFGSQYEELYSAADTLAERIRTLDLPSPGSCIAFAKESSIVEAGEELLSDEIMITTLISDNEKVVASLEFACDRAGRLKDLAIQNLLIDRIDAHKKALWMLKSLAKEPK